MEFARGLGLVASHCTAPPSRGRKCRAERALSQASRPLVAALGRRREHQEVVPHDLALPGSPDYVDMPISDGSDCALASCYEVHSSYSSIGRSP